MYRRPPRETIRFSAEFRLLRHLTDVGETNAVYQQNIQSHFGGLAMHLMMGMCGNTQQTLLSFPDERPGFLLRKHYSVVSYLLSR